MCTSTGWTVKELSPESAYHEGNNDLADSIKSSKTEITKCNSINSRWSFPDRSDPFMNRYYIKEKKCTSFSSSIDKRYYFYCGQSDSSLYFGLLGQAWGSIQSDVKDQELVPPATCQNQQKKITAIPFYFNTGFFYLKSAILKYRAQGSFKLFFEIFTSGFVGLKRRFLRRRTR